MSEVSVQDVDASISPICEETILAAPAGGLHGDMRLLRNGEGERAHHRSSDEPSGLNVAMPGRDISDDQDHNASYMPQSFQPSIHQSYVETRLASVHVQELAEQAAIGNAAHAEKESETCAEALPNGGVRGGHGKEVDEKENDFPEVWLCMCPRSIRCCF